MIIKNNKPKAQWLHYKIAGKIFKRHFTGFETIDISEITDTSQIISNTYERRIRHIEDAFGFNFGTAFEIPGDPDFTAFIITASSSLSGTISPSGAVKVSEGENKTFYMAPNAVSFGTSANTLGSSGGTISPNGTSVASTAYYYLSALNVDGDANQLSAITGNASATTQYTFNNVITSHTITSTFKLVTGSTVFTMTPSTNYYLNAFSLNGSNQLSGVTGSVSGATTYNLTNISANNTLNVLFKPYGE